MIEIKNDYGYWTVNKKYLISTQGKPLHCVIVTGSGFIVYEKQYVPEGILRRIQPLFD